MSAVDYEPFPQADDDADSGAHGQASRISLVRLLEGEPPPPPEMHSDKFLLAGDVNFLGGNGDAGKSTSLFHIAISTPIARPIFGTITVRKPGPVILLVPQDGRAVARHNCDAQIAGMNLTADERAILERDLYILDDRPYNLMTDTQIIGAKMREIGATLFAADPLASVIGTSDENEEAVAHAVCENARRDIGADGAAILIAGHLRKPERGGSDASGVFDLKGSVGWSNHARMVWTVSKPKGGDLITYRLVKSNRIPTGIEHQAKLAIEANPDNAAHWLTCRLTDANLGTSVSFTPGVGRAINDNERKALEALDDRLEPGMRFSNSRWQKESGITNENTFRSVKDRLLKAGLAVAEPTARQNPNGKSPVYQYGITPNGRATLNTGWTPEGVKL